MEIQQQEDEMDSQLEAHLPQESHLLSDILTPEAGPEPAQQPQLIPNATNKLVEGAAVRHSARQCKVPQRLIKIFEVEVTDSNDLYKAYKLLAQPDGIKLESDYEHPAVAFAASNNPDIMYWHEARGLKTVHTGHSQGNQWTNPKLELADYVCKNITL
jgi:hypothetical protein